MMKNLSIKPTINIDSKSDPALVAKVITEAVQKSYANGGIAKEPQLAVYGRDTGVDHYVPLADGRTIPVDVASHVKAERQSKVDKLLTATLETNVQHLDDLRRSLERTNQKNIADVRKAGGWGADLLAAIEGTITYFDLVQLVNEMRDGIARRRAAAQGVLA